MSETSTPAPTREQTFPAYAPRLPLELRASLLQIPIFGDENFLFVVTNIHPTETARVAVGGALWSEERRTVDIFEHRFDVAPGATTVQRLPLERGALLRVRAFTQSETLITLGDVWFRAILIKGLSGGITGTGTLLQGYITQNNDLAWPGSSIENLYAGLGVVRYKSWVVFNAKISSVVVPAGRRWRIITGNTVLISDATAGNRLVELQINHSASLAFIAEASPAQGPSLTLNYVLSPGVTATAVVPVRDVQLPFIPDLELTSGDEILIRCDQGAVAPAGDLFLPLFLVVREWFAGP